MNQRPHPATLELQKLLEQCEVKRTRRGGPGGQHRNKVESAIVIKHESGIVAEANERRNQHENRAVAVFRLRVNLALQMRSASTGERPSDLWRQRCRDRRISVNAAHQDFPALLAEALDAIDRFDYDLKPACEFLACSSSQLVRFLKMDRRALQLVNSQRGQCGRSVIK